MVLATVVLSELTKAWLLYLGLAFVLMVMYAPAGVAGLILANLRLAAFGKLRPLLPGYLALAGSRARSRSRARARWSRCCTTCSSTRRWGR